MSMMTSGHQRQVLVSVQHNHSSRERAFLFLVLEGERSRCKTKKLREESLKDAPIPSAWGKNLPEAFK